MTEKEMFRRVLANDPFIINDMWQGHACLARDPRLTTSPAHDTGAYAQAVAALHAVVAAHDEYQLSPTGVEREDAGASLCAAVERLLAATAHLGQAVEQRHPGGAPWPMAAFRSRLSEFSEGPVDVTEKYGIALRNFVDRTAEMSTRPTADIVEEIARCGMMTVENMSFAGSPDAAGFMVRMVVLGSVICTQQLLVRALN